MRQFDTLEGILGVLRRRFALLFSVILLGAILSVLIAISLPRQYETTAVVQIELPKVTETVTGPTTGSHAKYRMQLIEQQLMARDSLLSVIAEHGLFASGAQMSELDQVTLMRMAVQIDQIIDSTEAWRPDVVPSGLLITVRLGDAQQAADVANSFLTRILAQSEQRREEQVTQALSFFESEEARVGSKIAALDIAIAEFKRTHAASMPEGIASLRTQMSALVETELEIDSQIIALNASSSRVREEVLTRQIGELEQQKQLVASRIAEIEAAFRAAPQVERNFTTLSREMQQLQDQFSVITRRKAEAEMGQMLETSQQTERFEVLETALVPEHPVAPSRKKIVVFGTVLAAMLAGGIVVLLELLNPAIRTSAQLEAELGILPIVAIPKIGSKWQRRRQIFTWLSLLAAILLIAASLVKLATGRVISSLRHLVGNAGALAKSRQGSV